MPIILAAFILLPLVLGIILEYIVCRITRRRGWKLLPPAGGVLLTALIGIGRWRIWTSETVSPLTQILLFPVLPAVFLLLGLFLGWRLWRRLWLPRVVKDKRR